MLQFGKRACVLTSQTFINPRHSLRKSRAQILEKKNSGI